MSSRTRCRSPGLRRSPRSRGPSSRGPESSFAVTAYGPSAWAVMPRIDLHAHSNRSDGTFAPAESSDSHQNATSTSSRSPTTTRPTGSTRPRPGPSSASRSCPGSSSPRSTRPRASTSSATGWTRRTRLRAELSRLGDERFRRGELMVEKLRALGVPIEFEHVQRIANGATIVRPHVTQAMVEIGAVATEKEGVRRLPRRRPARPRAEARARPGGRGRADPRRGRRVRARAPGHVGRPDLGPGRG